MVADMKHRIRKNNMITVVIINQPYFKTYS